MFSVLSWIQGPVHRWCSAKGLCPWSPTEVVHQGIGDFCISIWLYESSYSDLVPVLFLLPSASVSSWLRGTPGLNMWAGTQGNNTPLYQKPQKNRGSQALSGGKWSPKKQFSSLTLQLSLLKLSFLQKYFGFSGDWNKKCRCYGSGLHTLTLARSISVSSLIGIAVWTRTSNIDRSCLNDKTKYFLNSLADIFVR